MILLLGHADYAHRLGHGGLSITGSIKTQENIHGCIGGYMHGKASLCIAVQELRLLLGCWTGVHHREEYIVIAYRVDRSTNSGERHA